MTSRIIYEARGFVLDEYHGDNEFNMFDLHQSLLPATLHICAKDEHVDFIERSIRTVKE